MRRAAFAVLLVWLAGCIDILGIDSASPPGEEIEQILDCDPVAQSGCQSDQKCGFVQVDPLTGFGEFDCVDDGTVPEGGACDATAVVDDCEAGLQCVQGTCLEICGDGVDCSRGDCGPLAEKAAVGIDLEVCIESCSAFAQDCGELSCFLGSNDGPLCLLPGAVPEGNPCRDSVDCAPGLGCHRTFFGDRLCLAYCDQPSCSDSAGEPNACGCSACGVEQVCVDFFEPELSGQGQGICVFAGDIGCFCKPGMLVCEKQG